MDGTIITKPINEQQLKLEAIALSATKYAAEAVRPLLGCGDRMQIDRAGTSAIREALNSSEGTFVCVSTEGTRDERDKDTMILLGEKLGLGGPEVDFVTDPVEGTNLAAVGDDGCCSVLAFGKNGSLGIKPDTFVKKFIFGIPESEHSIEPHWPFVEKLVQVALLLGKPVEELQVVTLDRKRHTSDIAKMKSMGITVVRTTDCDLMPAILTTLPEKSAIDVLCSIGGAPEGELSALAIAGRGTIHMSFLTRDMLTESTDQAKVSEDMGEILNAQGLEPGRVYTGKELVPEWGIFAATSIKKGGLFLPHLRDGIDPDTSVLITSGVGIEPKVIWE